MKKRFLNLLALLLLLCFTNQVKAQWVEKNDGLYGAKVISLAVSGTNLFAGTQGGVYLSANNGSSWIPVNSGLPNRFVRSLQIDGTNLFAGTTVGVYLSSDNGTSWNSISTGLTNLVVNALAVSGTNLFAGTFGGGVFRSTNNGTSWTAVNIGLASTASMAVRSLVISGTDIFVGTNGGVFRSIDNGGNWTAASAGLPNGIVRSFAVSGANLFVVVGSQVFLSTNNGTSWTLANAGMGLNPSSLAVSGTKLFAGTNGDGVFLSEDNGISWTAIGVGIENSYVYAIAVSGQYIFTGGLCGVFLSTDSGSSWTVSNAGLTNTFVNSFAVSGQNLIAGSDGAGIFLSTNGGDSWVEGNDGFTDPLNKYISSVVFNGTNLFAGTVFNGVFSSANGGTSWMAVNSGMLNSSITSLAVIGTNIFAGGEGVFLSINNGSSWTIVSAGLPNLDVTSIAVSGANLFAATVGGGVYISTDNGSNWTAVNVGLTNTDVLCLMVSGTNLFAGTIGGGVYLSTNNGSSWTEVNTGLTNRDVNCLMVSGTNLFAGTGEGIFLSIDNGSSWTAVNAGLEFTSVTSLAVSGNKLLAGISGKGVWSRPLSDFIKVNQTITFNTLLEKMFGDASFTLPATATSGLSVSYSSSDETVATVSGNILTIVGAGVVNLTAKQAGDANYNAALDVTQTLTVSKANQTVTFLPIAIKTFGDASFALSAAATSNLTVSYLSSDETVATISGNMVTIVGGGSTTITAKQAGNSNYNEATDVTEILTVNKADQSITFKSLITKTFGDAVFNLSSSATSGMPVSYASSDETVATISGSTVTIVGAGSTTIAAKQPGNANYNAATDVVQTLIVSKANQTIAFLAISTKAFGDGPFNLTGTSSSGLAVQYTTTSDKISLTGKQVSLNKAGSVTINADQPGNGNYNSAATVSQSFCINPSKPIITTSGLNSGTPVLTSSSTTGNQWYKNGTLLPDEVSNTLLPKSDGSYTVKVTVDNCLSELSAEQILVITGDISSSGSSFLIYPNPVKDNLSINLLAFDGNSQVEIVIYDVSGKVMDKVLRQGERTTVSVGSYSVGTYFLKASQLNQIHVAKFAKE